MHHPSAGSFTPPNQYQEARHAPCPSRQRVLLVVLALGACGKKDGDAKSTDSIPQDSSQQGSTLTLPVVGEEVRQGDLILTVSATGLVRTDASATIKAETGGTVAATVRAGDRVEKGQVLARLDPKPLDLAVQEAERGSPSRRSPIGPR